MRINSGFSNPLYVLRNNNLNKSIRLLSRVDTFVPSFSKESEIKKLLKSDLLFDFSKISGFINITPEQQLHHFLHKKGKVSVEEYQDIVQNYPIVLEKAQNYIAEFLNAETSPSDIAKFAFNVKNYFDNCEQLKGCKYKIISIGTSPATLTEALKNLGCDVVFMPITGIRFCNSPEDAFKYDNFELAMDYVKSKCENDDDDTKYIVLDYAASGKTLDTISRYLASENGISTANNVLKMSIKDLTKKVINSREVPLLLNYSKDERLDFCFNYNLDLSGSGLSEYCNVPHFFLREPDYFPHTSNISSANKSKDKLFTEFDNFSQKFGRCFSLCTIHEMQKLKESLNEDK